MIGRSHPYCWTENGYQHTCHEPSGKVCVTQGCNNEAGTPWTPLWCPDCDVVRQDQISVSLNSLLESLQ